MVDAPLLETFRVQLEGALRGSERPSWRCPWSLQGTWPLKIHSTPNYFMILCLYDYINTKSVSQSSSRTAKKWQYISQDSGEIAWRERNSCENLIKILSYTETSKTSEISLKMLYSIYCCCSQSWLWQDVVHLLPVLVWSSWILLYTGQGHTASVKARAGMESLQSVLSPVCSALPLRQFLSK